MKYFPKDKKQLMMAALGKIPCDLAITNAQLVNTFTGEVYKANVFCHQGFVAHVETEDFDNVNAVKVIDAKGEFLCPGFIDAHVHIESSMMIPRNFAKAVIPHGTTTVITDPHEIANVYGVRAVEYMTQVTKDLPMRMYVDIPSCVPSVPKLENAGAEFMAKDIKKMLNLTNVIGLAEVMDFIGVYNADERMMDILNVFEEDGRYIQGHAPGLTGRKLSSYRIGGPTTCHETRMSEEVKPKMRSGMYVDARSSSIAKNIPEIIQGLDGVKFYDRLTFCTDDREVDEIVEGGHINDVLRDALKCGLDPIVAIKSCTLNAANAVHIENLGAIAPGYVADMLLMPSLENLQPSHVFFDGELVAKDGKLLATIKPMP
ncbi:MAG: amidohydrolase family protein, partial [Oscillospiraceae bacterium]